MITNFEIRPANEKDITSLLKLEEECFVSPWKKENLEYELNENPVSVVNVATVSDCIVGYLDYWITFDSATICQICVDKKFRNQKIASALIKDMIDDCYAKRVANITLEVRANNKPAISLYNKHGFMETLVKKSYYSNGDDALYMVRKVEL